MCASTVLEQLTFARRIADHAALLGIQGSTTPPRAISGHIGAILADSILQAGVNYQTVVRTRIERIHAQYPDTATLSGLISLIEREQAADFLLWKHPTKLMRFVSLARFLALQDIDTTEQLKQWLYLDTARGSLLNLPGIGPKTCDYLCCLVGIDSIAVDRHIKTFANEAGVTISDYDGLKAVVSYAADLLGIARRDLDGWIWTLISARAANDKQLPLPWPSREVRSSGIALS